MTAIYNKLGKYLKNIYIDYHEVFKDVRQSAKNRPLRAGLYGVSTLFVFNLFRTNGDLRMYHDEIILACTRINSLAESLRNPRSDKFMKVIGELNGHRQLRQINLGFSTLIYRADVNPENALYRYNCPHLSPPLKEFITDRLIDFGLMGHWLMLETNMRDYDVNDELFDQTGSQGQYSES